MAFSRPHSLVAVTPDDPAYEIRPSHWNENHVPAGADVGGIPYCPTATTETTSANLTYTETSGPRLQVGSGTGTSAGWVLGYSGATGNAILWNTNGGDTNTAFTLKSDGNSTYLNAPASTLALRTANTTKLSILITAGYGASITAGTATTDVQALSATQTWNAAGVTFTGIKYTITDTASAAGSLAMQILGGAAGTTNLMSLTKNGDWTLASATVFSAATSFNIRRGATDIVRFDGSLGAILEGGAVRIGSTSTSISELSAGLIGVGTGAAASTAGSLSLTNTTHAGYSQLTEMTAPAGAANSARLFTQDNGAGKTQLMVIFGSGAAQQIAIEA